MTNAELLKDLAVLMSQEKWQAIFNISSAVLEEMKIARAKEDFAEPVEEVVEEVTKEQVPEVGEVVEEKPKKSNGATRKEREAKEEIPAKFTKESLEGLSYNTLKKLASDLSISAKGSKPTLIENILKETVTVPMTEENIIPEEELTEEEKEEAIESEAIPEEEEEADEEPTLAEEVEEIVAEMTDEEIRDLLVEHGITKVKGKRQALIEAVIKAVEDGVIIIDDSEEEEVESEDTPARTSAMTELADEVMEAYESGDLTREEMEEFISETKGEEIDFSDVTDEDLMAGYINMQCDYIDDEGNFHENPKEDYLVRGELFCCGMPMQLDKKGKKYFCEICDHTVKA